jgi:phage baseplate assembly protein W
MAQFRGFSTQDRVNAPYTLEDADIVKQDLLNEIFTRKGERVMRPNYGSIIWDMLMDPNTPDLRNTITQDMQRIVDRDPRVEIIDIQVLVLDHTIRVEMRLSFQDLDNEDILYLNFDRNITEGNN